MNIGILGSGVVGQTLGSGLLKLGNQVKLGTRDPLSEVGRVLLQSNPQIAYWAFRDAGDKDGLSEAVSELAKINNIPETTLNKILIG